MDSQYKHLTKLKSVQLIEGYLEKRKFENIKKWLSLKG